MILGNRRWKVQLLLYFFLMVVPGGGVLVVRKEPSHQLHWKLWLLENKEAKTRVFGDLAPPFLACSGDMLKMSPNAEAFCSLP